MPALAALPQCQPSQPSHNASPCRLVCMAPTMPHGARDPHSFNLPRVFHFHRPWPRWRPMQRLQHSHIRACARSCACVCTHACMHTTTYAHANVHAFVASASAVSCRRQHGSRLAYWGSGLCTGLASTPDLWHAAPDSFVVAWHMLLEHAVARGIATFAAEDEGQEGRRQTAAQRDRRCQAAADVAGLKTLLHI